ncbi:YveK family protein [Jingyaoa shaoxingensis]|uniref:Polysaccharide chain length determinant N-terminal domain-containing protein n=1 Tax=Jingyaoa shaoxingensis TaxID=2763671 RepID=A0ABR7NCH7_9FIRM|nr:Wzz/FepE/Etk N-terminal domain-containing protein [Jingyaoa shaoxingensis]MBC8574096.1 hypothetical protein [Jingyaoa shaoxingensis]
MENTMEKQPVNLNTQDAEMEIDLLEIFYLLKSKWKEIFLALLVGALIFGAYHTFLVKPSYQADASIYITNTESALSFSDLQLSSALTDDYANIIKSRTVLNRVIEELDLNLDYKQLAKLVAVSNPDSTHIVDIKVTCDDPEMSRNITNALLNISVSQIYQIIGSGEPTVIDYSVAEAVQDVTPSLFKYLAIGGFLGACVACAIFILQMLMDGTMKTEEDIDKYLHLPVLATVPYYNEKKGK